MLLGRYSAPVIVVVGEALVDLIVREDGSVTAVPGGGPYNVARALGRLGRSVAFLGRLSTDRFGRILRARLVADGVNLTWTPTTDDPTTLAVAELDAGGAATYHFHTAATSAAGLLPSDLPDGLPAGTVALHVGTLGLVLEPTATTIESLVATAPPDVLVMLDPNCRPSAIGDPAAYRSRLARILDRADLIKVSTDDIGWLEPTFDHVRGTRALLAGFGGAPAAGPRAALLTDGGRPVRIVTADAIATVDVPTIDIVDTVGAGDAFGAGFLAAWTHAGHGRADLGDVEALVEATRFAVEVGARTASRAGAEPPTNAELGWPPA